MLTDGDSTAYRAVCSSTPYGERAVQKFSANSESMARAAATATERSRTLQETCHPTLAATEGTEGEREKIVCCSNS